MSNPEILIIDDEVQIRKLLRITLNSHNYKVVEAETAEEGILSAANHPPDMILLDIGLPDESGHSVLQKIRRWYNRPIMVLSVQDNEEDIVLALDNGANDYLVKPFRTGELLARIRSLLRKDTSEKDNPRLVFNDLEMDLSARIVKKQNSQIKLTATEFSLLSLLVKNQGKVLTHQFMLKEIWGPSFINESQYLRVFIAQLRKKIEQDPNKPMHIITESGVGYRFM
jgi:two-component system, OmpR family, KDP operon response regulator KdpE